jgi:transposase
MEPRELQEYRYRAVREVLDGSAIGEVAVRYGTSRQSLDTWRKRFLAEGLLGLLERSRRPRTSPARSRCRHGRRSIASWCATAW